ncbi:hypothetical protein CFB47_16875 [Burkholderia sp. AU27893]|uniref:Uncharacterized protein n=1 Tax=Burkholderia contaminans TaxID=488447 RepID=A0A2S5DW92_9BURK|nr:hypothetical protein CFB47_16875 [Burkholderia sp. AU27893]POZ83347.1 hypothetical protein C3743_24840 [Burkholderia contaminans]
MTGVSPATQDGADDSARVYPVQALARMLQPRASEYAVDGLDGLRRPGREDRDPLRAGQRGTDDLATHGGAQASRHVLRTNQVRLAVPSSAR